MKISNSIILIISIFLTGCSSEKEVETKEKTDAEHKTEAESKNNQQPEILAPHLKTLNQAKDMGKTLQDAEAERKKKMDEQEEASEDEDTN